MSNGRFITSAGNSIGASAAKAGLKGGDRVVAPWDLKKPRYVLRDLVITVLLAGSFAAYAQETPIQVRLEDGKTTAQFKVGDSRCLLVDDEIRCTRIAK